MAKTIKPDYEFAIRESLAAVAMAFAPATDVPRDQALMRTAIVSLIRSFGEESFTYSDAINSISHNGNLPELRPNTAESVFRELISYRVIIPQGEGPDLKYAFNADFIVKANKEQDRINKQIDKVIKDLFHTAKIPVKMIPKLREEMLFALARLMEEYGKQYAYQIAGRCEHFIAINNNDLIAICKDASSEDMVKFITPEEMASAITEMFSLREPHFASFAYSLTRNYYFMRLICLDGGLNFLSQDRFSGAQFFIDTNLLVPFLFEESRHRRSARELINIAKQLNISLHTSELTIDELRGIFNFYGNELYAAFDEVPDELVQKTRSVFLRAYRLRQLRN